jgi:hypothetical protein
MDEDMGMLSDSGFDTAQIEKVISMVKLIKGLSDINGGEVHNDENTDISSSDELQALNALNAAVPYLDYKFRKPVGMMVKLIEMNRLMNSFEVMSVGGEGEAKERKKRMLLAIRPELDAKKQRMLDVFVRLIEIRDIMGDEKYAGQN